MTRWLAVAFLALVVLAGCGTSKPVYFMVNARSRPVTRGHIVIVKGPPRAPAYYLGEVRIRVLASEFGDALVEMDRVVRRAGGNVVAFFSCLIHREDDAVSDEKSLQFFEEGMVGGKDGVPFESLVHAGRGRGAVHGSGTPVVYCKGNVYRTVGRERPLTQRAGGSS